MNHPHDRPLRKMTRDLICTLAPVLILLTFLALSLKAWLGNW